LTVWRRVVDHLDLTDRRQREYFGQAVDAAGRGTGPQRPVLPGEEGPEGAPSPLYAVGHYLSVVLGVIGKYFLQFTSGRSHFSWHTIVASVILAAVVFPYVYRRVMSRNGSGAMQFFVSFQHGFFFQSILEQVERML